MRRSMAYPIERQVVPMLSRPDTRLQRGSGWLYEPKYDGFCALIFRDSDRLDIGSRNGNAHNQAWVLT